MVGCPNERRRKYAENVELRERVLILRNALTDDQVGKIMTATKRVVDVHGWTSDRHREYPTQDIPVFELSKRAFVYIRKVCRERILNEFAKVSGLNGDDLYFKDLFIVNYDATSPTGQTELRMHKDGSLFSFNVSLTDSGNFTGGGTEFPLLGPVKIEKGDAVCHDGKVLHAGCKVQSGCRTILVGFIDTIVSEEDDEALTTETKLARRHEMELSALRARITGPRRQGGTELWQDALFALAGPGDDDEEDTNEHKQKIEAEKMEKSTTAPNRKVSARTISELQLL